MKLRTQKRNVKKHANYRKKVAEKNTNKFNTINNKNS